MKILITGGTGFIGSRLALEGIRRGHRVRVFGQVNTAAERQNREQLDRQSVEVVLGSVIEQSKVAAAVSGCDLVFHLAAAQHESNVPDQHFRDVNVAGTRHVLEACHSGGVKRVVHGSTIGVYGEAMEGALDESSPVKPNSIYGETKLEGERLVLSYADRLPLSIIRISETYGPGDRRLLKLFKAVRSKMFFMIGRGENIHQLIYIDDLVEGMFLAAERPEALGKLYVLAGSEMLTTNDMVAAIADVLCRSGPQRRLPLWPFLAAGFILEKTLRPLGIKPPLHRRRLDFFRKSFYFNPGKSNRDLGFQPKTPFREGAELTVRWYRDQGLL